MQHLQVQVRLKYRFKEVHFLMPQQLSYKKVFLSMYCLLWRLNNTTKEILFSLGGALQETSR